MAMQPPPVVVDLVKGTCPQLNKIPLYALEVYRTIRGPLWLSSRYQLLKGAIEGANKLARSGLENHARHDVVPSG
jgi:hypothetical protein